MSVLPKVTRTMRIIALPLALPKIPPDHNLKPHAVFNPNRMLVYYHFDLSQGNSVRSQDQSAIKRAVKWASTKAADLWAGFGKAPEGSWKLRTYELGERIVDRIDFEELALKGVDPSLGPSITHADITGQEANEVKSSEKQTPREALRIPLIYPPSIYASLPSTGVNEVSHPSIVHLRTLLSSREPRHRRGFWMWMAIAPLTAPFILVPVIPNLPFFFCAWRSWSHYRAYRTSQYLSSLLEHGFIAPEPSPALDQLYASYAPSLANSEIMRSPAAPPPRSAASLPVANNSNAYNCRPSNDATASSSQPDVSNVHKTSRRLLLTRDAIPHILQLFGLPQSSAADMYRAVEQVRGRLGGTSGR
ncbi:mitochondrial K+-H+ exchange-related-domain-containing protein [Suillus clintonianus]|uniref:mitochondrial K+-H+ exchange-related-domain-containing protein n=1 Tax=Suillus clintonianus TaxID=1904413 RepID=UPI001B8817D9|nr:mitochondrial K+-H+ exchange-related-domain-containing protein [Suillus clintonianus]KAG2151325.1 mitochondrial K+-H+ exchange-related-domain-containing protein [Suillus clintonianus]